ncbi:Pre-mRNA-splicing factor cwf16 [Tieghemiomyces parasiticus]|uniref:Splicing factor YJU2 n=1 Tax=Tieghemiomyces parasiticus TaxID=78921 RepID=A0A9W8DZ92_9FUNG|nr:Pre-mRNA-splicing factor cwf16 [Tieghemiomyces parasiticus]
MSERKVLNKYFPPDFDPSKVPRSKKPKVEQHKVRLMAPFSMRCNTCGEYIAAHKKFNARKETVHGEKYLSIQIFRFYIRCPRCAAEITFKTDPENLDYVAEHGAKRNFESAKATTQTPEERRQAKEAAEEELDPMKALENRTAESKREMEMIDALDELRTRNARAERIGNDQLLDKLAEDKRRAEEEAKAAEGPEFTEEEEAMVKALFQSRGTTMAAPITGKWPAAEAVKEDDDPTAHLRRAKERLLGPAARTTAAKPAPAAALLGVTIKPKAAAALNSPAVPVPKVTRPAPTSAPAEGLGDLLGGYSSDEASDDSNP